jgi:hypothetical protein
MDPQHEELPYTLKVPNGSLTVFDYHLYLNDYTTFAGSERAPRELGQVWRDTVSRLHEEGERYPSMIAWGLHPYLSGRPYRAPVLEEFLAWAQSLPGVWFARCGDLADYWQSEYPDHLVEEWPHFTERGTPLRDLQQAGAR